MSRPSLMMSPRLIPIRNSMRRRAVHRRSGPPSRAAPQPRNARRRRRCQTRPAIRPRGGLLRGHGAPWSLDRRARPAALSGVRACPPRPFPSAANPPPHRRRGSRQDGESGSFWQSYATQGVASARLDDDYPLAPAQRQAPRASQEVLPPIRHGQPDWRAWARKLRLLTGQLTIIELHWLRTDNRPPSRCIQASPLRRGARRPLPSGMSPAIKRSIWNRQHQHHYAFRCGDSKLQHGAANSRLTNATTRLTSGPYGFNQCANQYSALIALKTEFVNDLFSFFDCRADQGSNHSDGVDAGARTATDCAGN